MSTLANDSRSEASTHKLERVPVWQRPTRRSGFLSYLVFISDRTRRLHLFFILIQLAGVVLALYWSGHSPPAPGYAIGALAVVAAVMSVHGEMRVVHKLIWMLLIAAFLFLEFRAIDVKTAQDKDAFQAIADGIKRTIAEGQRHFDGMMTGIGQVPRLVALGLESSRRNAATAETLKTKTLLLSKEIFDFKAMWDRTRPVLRSVSNLSSKHDVETYINQDQQWRSELVRDYFVHFDVYHRVQNHLAKLTAGGVDVHNAVAACAQPATPDAINGCATELGTIGINVP